MRKLRIMTVFGTRPEAIKMCPLVLEMRKYTDFIEPSGNAGPGVGTVCHQTGL